MCVDSDKTKLNVIILLYRSPVPISCYTHNMFIILL